MGRWLTMGLGLLLGAGPAAGQELEWAWDLYRSGRVAEAASLAGRAVATSPEDVRWRLLAGQALADLERFDSAAVHLERVLELDAGRGWPTAWADVHLARARFAEGRYPEAAALLEEALALRATRNATRSARSLQLLLGLAQSYEGWRTVETPHLRLRFDPGADVDPERFARDREAAFEELADFFGGTPPKKVDVLVWASDDAASRAGLGRLGFSRPELSLVHTRWRQSRGHELVHVVSHHTLHPVRKTRLVNEGLAVLLDLTDRDLLAGARAATGRAGDDGVSVVDLWREGADTPEPLLYPIAGAFMEHLLREGGKERFLRLAADQSLESARTIYGPELDRLIESFEARLRQ